MSVGQLIFKGKSSCFDSRDAIANQHYVTTFYKFKPLSQIETVKGDLERWAAELKVLGLIIIGAEGFNATVSCHDSQDMERFKDFVRSYFSEPTLFFKDSQSHKKPFRRFKVKVRPEIVTLAVPDLVPNEEKNHHLSPAEWNSVLKTEEDVLVIDTRNWYETKIGTFERAVNPGIDKFSEFPAFVEKNQIPKDKKMLIFCTGGIRCEKGILELQEQGFSNVYQLDGGILNYLDQFPNDQFKGECFVFDQRVALTQTLAPSEKYSLCPHCGQPADIPMTCGYCSSSALVCDRCVTREWKKDTCSKDCSYQFELKSRTS
jgi:UPF0176 protein